MYGYIDIEITRDVWKAWYVGRVRYAGSIYMYTCRESAVCGFYIYVYIEREKERKTEREVWKAWYVGRYYIIYIYIYIYI